MFAIVLNAVFSFLSAAFKGVRGAVAYSFGTAERRKLSAQAIVFTLGFLAIERVTVGWFWLWPALLDTAYVLVINAIGLWIDGDHPVSVIVTPANPAKSPGSYYTR